MIRRTRMESIWTPASSVARGGIARGVYGPRRCTTAIHSSLREAASRGSLSRTLETNSIRSSQPSQDSVVHAIVRHSVGTRVCASCLREHLVAIDCTCKQEISTGDDAIAIKSGLNQAGLTFAMPSACLSLQASTCKRRLNMAEVVVKISRESLFPHIRTM